MSEVASSSSSSSGQQHVDPVVQKALDAYDSSETSMKLVMLRNAALTAHCALEGSPEELKCCALLRVTPERLRALGPLLSAAYMGNVAGVNTAIHDSLDLVGGVPADILSWLSLFPASPGGAPGQTADYLGVVRALVDAGAVVAEIDLMAAVQRIGITENPTVWNNCSLNSVQDWACGNGFVDVFRFLIERGASRDIAISDIFSEDRNVPLIRYLIEEKMLPTPTRAQTVDTQDHARMREWISFARMNGANEVIRVLQEEGGYDMASFQDNHERHKSM